VVADIIFCPGAIVQYRNSDGAWMESFRVTVELWAESMNEWVSLIAKQITKLVL
jgi:hypothetical protein